MAAFELKCSQEKLVRRINSRILFKRFPGLVAAQLSSSLSLYLEVCIYHFERQIQPDMPMLVHNPFFTKTEHQNMLFRCTVVIQPWQESIRLSRIPNGVLDRALASESRGYRWRTETASARPNCPRIWFQMMVYLLVYTGVSEPYNSFTGILLVLFAK